MKKEFCIENVVSNYSFSFGVGFKIDLKNVGNVPFMYKPQKWSGLWNLDEDSILFIDTNNIHYLGVEWTKMQPYYCTVCSLSFFSLIRSRFSRSNSFIRIVKLKNQKPVTSTFFYQNLARYTYSSYWQLRYSCFTWPHLAAHGHTSLLHALYLIRRWAQ